MQSYVIAERLMDALKSRPIIYTGGSTFTILRRGYGASKTPVHSLKAEWHQVYR